MTTTENKSQEDINLNAGEPAVEGQQPSKKEYTPLEKQLYARLKKAETRLGELGHIEDEIAPAAGPSSQGSDSSQWQERMELIARGYTDESELDFIMGNGGKKALENPFVKDALQVRRDQRSAEATVTMNNDAKSFVERTYTQAEIAKMSADEYAAVLAGKKR
jgi:hypothetical protein